MRYTILTWGCQMNEHDSEKMAGVLREMGYERSASPDESDVVLLNTCAIREKAVDKVFSELGRLRAPGRGGEPPILGLCGCVAPLEGERIFERFPWVDFVLGPRGIANLPAMIEAARGRRRSIDVAHHQESVLFPWQLAERREGAHAYVTVIEGCNKPCAFCIVPKTRGAEASRSVEEVLREVEALAASGRREIEFLGQTVNAYKDPEGRRLAVLLAAANRVPGVERIRFTTSHPVHLTDDLITAMADLEKVCPHIHLPVQSGSDVVLRRMRRGYDRAGYLRRVDALRRAVEDVEVSTDMIVGFPGETERDFADTLSLLDEARFGTVYAFTYSPRPGTEAVSLPDEVPGHVKDERLAAIFERQRSIQERAQRAMIGTLVEVMLDGPSKRRPEEATGRTPQNQIVNFQAPGREPGDLLSVRVSAASAFSLRGTVVS